MIRRIGLVSLCLAILSLSLVAEGKAESNAGGTVVLKMGDPHPDRATGWGAVIEKINAEFKAAHPNVQIVTESYQDQAWQEKVKIYATANQLPDVMKYWSFPTLLKPLVEGGFVEPLDKATFAKYGYMAGSLEGNEIGGKLYGIPVSGDLWVIYVNKKVFADAGVALPSTWEDIVASVPKFKAKNIVPMVTDGKDGWPLCITFDNIYQRLWGDFGPIHAAITRQGSFNTPEFVKAAKYLQDLAKAGVFQADLVTSDYGASRNLFGQERAAMYVMGSWEMGLATDPNFAQSFRDNLDVIKFPVVSGGKGKTDDLMAWFGGNYIINAKSKNKALALEYLKLYAEKFPGYAWDAGACFPAQKVTPKSTDSVAAKKLLQIAADAKSTSGTPSLDRATASFKETEQDLCRQLMAGIITPEDFCKQLDAAADKASKE